MNMNGLPSDLEDLLDTLSPEEARHLRTVWELAGVPSTELDVTRVDQVRQRLRDHRESNAQLLGTERTLTPVFSLRRYRFRLIAGVAVVLLLGAVGLALWIQPVTHTAPVGERLTVNLPDGSSVVLNSGSSVHYARAFDDKRRVTLEGEGYFDVVHDTRPFLVETFNAQVTVLGTRFNVRAWPSDMIRETVVVLESGQVALAAVFAPTDTVVLAPNQIGRVVADTTRPTLPQSISTTSTLAWRNGSLDFRGQWLGLILNDLERRYGLTFQYQPTSLNRKQLSFVFRRQPEAEVVVEHICRALGLKYRTTSTGFELYEPTDAF